MRKFYMFMAWGEMLMALAFTILGILYTFHIIATPPASMVAGWSAISFADYLLRLSDERTAKAEGK